MSAAVQLTDQAPQAISVDLIKKAFIKLNELEAKNESFSQFLASEAHVKQVKVWLQDQERELGVKVDVISGVESLPQDTRARVLPGAPGIFSEGRYLMFANDIKSHQQAICAYEYIVVGLGALVNYLGSKQAKVCTQIYRHLTSDQQEYLQQKFKLESASSESVATAVMAYLAEVSALAIRPTFAQRRESWQRYWLRKFYAKLSWTPTDLHFLISCARKKS